MEKSRLGGLASAKRRAKGGLRVVQPKGNTSSSSSTSTSKKEYIYKKGDSDDPVWLRFCENCEKLGLENKTKPSLYLETIKEYLPFGSPTIQVKECLYWCKDNMKKTITITRIRKWLNNWKTWSKDKELKQMTAKQDKNPSYTPPARQTRKEPTWTPPQ